MGLRGRLMLSVAIALVPAMLVLLYAGYEQRQHILEDVRTDALQFARATAAEHRKVMRDTRQTLQILAQMPQIRSPRTEECSPMLRAVMSGQEHLLNLGLIALDGSVACSVVPLPGPVDLSDRPYFKRALEKGGLAIGPYQIGRITGQPSINFGYPVLGEAGTTVGVVFAAVSLGWIETRFDELSLAQGTEVRILGPDHRLLTRYPRSDTAADGEAGDDSIGEAADALNGEGTAVLVGDDGVRRLFAFIDLMDTVDSGRLMLGFGIPLSIAYASLDWMLARNGAILLGAVLLAMLAAWCTGGSLVVRPVRALLKTARGLEAGNLSARAPALADGGELGALCRAFNAMAQSLEQRIADSQEQIERIRRLNRVYAVLSAINGAILRAQDRQALLQEACRIAVDHGGFLRAWVAVPDKGGRALRPVASAGADGPPISRFEIPPTCSSGDHPVILAFCTAEATVRTDLSEDGAAGWEAASSTKGCRTICALPVSTDAGVSAVLVLCSHEDSRLDEDELRLLRELAADTGLGLALIDRQQQIQRLASYDSITGLPNRFLFEEHLANAIARARHHGRHVGVMSVEIAGFRSLNEAFGYAAGDGALQAVAKQLAAAMRDGDTVARQGSDEFGVVLADIAKADDLPAVVARIVEGIPKHALVQGQEVGFSVNVGVAMFPQDAADPDALLRCVDAAADAAKEEPATTVTFFSPAMDARARRGRQVESELCNALGREEFALVYQPIFDIATGKMEGVEALLRWRNRVLGQVSPAEFIPIAERTGLICDIGEWVLTEALTQAIRWRESGHPRVCVSINVSPVQLRNPLFPGRVERALGQGRFDTEVLSVALEITESQLMACHDEVVSVLHWLKERGFALYIDDFGTGYSSLAYLKQLPVDTLKIDKSFIDDIGRNESADTMVHGIVALAHGLRMRVIAEGVETHQQLELLRHLKCDAAQGYYLSKPVVAAAIWKTSGSE